MTDDPDSRKEDRETRASPEDIEEETRRLMEKALRTGAATVVAGPTVGDETQPGATRVPTTLEETFDRIRDRMIDILASVEESLANAEPALQEQVSAATEEIAKKLKASGMGVFYTRMMSIIRNEIASSLSPEEILRPVRETVAEAREEVADIVSKVSRGTLKAIARRLGRLQSRVIQLYATLQERERQIEVAQASIFKLRRRVAELEERVKDKDSSIVALRNEIEALRRQIGGLEQQLEERDGRISQLTSELAQAHSQIEQQAQMIEKLGSAEEIVADYEAKLARVSELEGEVARLKSELRRRDEMIESLRREASEAYEYSQAYEKKIDELVQRVNSLTGEVSSLRSENDSLKTQIAELTARWNTLYQVAEDEPAFKAYFLVADKTRGVSLTHLAQALGIPAVRLREQLKRFIEVGLVEIVDGKVKPRALSDVARDLQGQEAKMIEEVRAEMGDDAEIVLEAFDTDESPFGDATDG